MTRPPSIGGPAPTPTPPPSQGPQGEISGEITPTMDGLKTFLEKEGRPDLFKQFQMSMILPSIQQTQKAIDKAKQAARKMREDQ